MTEETKRLDILPATSKEQLKEALPRIAAKWPPYDKDYNEERFFTAIDHGIITTEEEIEEQFRIARMMMI